MGIAFTKNRDKAKDIELESIAIGRINPSPPSLDAPYKDVWTGNGASPGMWNVAKVFCPDSF